MRTALIAGIVAAVVAAASGTAATLVVTSKTIKDGTIQLVDLSAQTKRALKGSRGVRGAAGAPGPAGAQGVQGPQGIQGPPGIQRLNLVTGSALIQPGNQRTVTATCAPGEIAVSGGYGLDTTDAAVLQSYGNGRTWIVEAENPPPPGVSAANVSAYAYCAPGITFVP